MAEKTFLDILSDGFDAAKGAFNTYLDFELKDAEIDQAKAQRTADATADAQAAPKLPAPTLDAMLPKIVLGGVLLIGGVMLWKAIR